MGLGLRPPGVKLEGQLGVGARDWPGCAISHSGRRGSLPSIWRVAARGFDQSHRANGVGNPGLNPETHFQQRTGTEHFHAEHFKPLSVSPGELAGGRRGRKAGMAVSPMPPRERHWLQTAPIPDKPRMLPPQKIALGMGEVCRLALFCFKLKKLSCRGFWGSSSPGRLEGGS